MPEDNSGNTQQQVAAELKRVRLAAGLSQEQLATRLGMDYAPGGRRVSTGRAAVSAWERGRRTPPEQHLRAYLDLGGDPAILTLRPDRQPDELPTEVPATVPTASWFLRHGPRWRWLALLSTVVVVAIGATFLVAALHSGPGTPATTWTETTGTPAHTWANATQLTGAGAPLGPRQSVQVVCRMRGYVVQDGDPWWYRLVSSPWNGHYYATSDAFYNDGATSGPVDTGVVVDEQVPLCS